MQIAGQTSLILTSGLSLTTLA